MRTITYTIPTQFHNHKISEFLKHQGYSKQLLTSLRHQKKAIFYGKNEVHMNQLLDMDESIPLTIHLHETDQPSNIAAVNLLDQIDIIYEDEDLFVINKPAGMPIQPSKSNPDNSLGNALAYLYETRKSPFVYRCVNRLDCDTSGLTIVAKNPLAAGILYNSVKDRTVKRTYYAIVETCIHNDYVTAYPEGGNLHLIPDLGEFGTINLPISREEATDQQHSIRRYIDEMDGATAISHYRLLSRNNLFSLYELSLDTGRTHQIRVHMTATGHPLLGDFLYHPTDSHMDRQALHAGKLSFIHPIKKEPLSFEVPIPKDMSSIFN